MKLEWYQRLYHGSNQIVKTPDLRLSREDIDFGVGFYLTTDINMAKKWSVSRATSVLNTYSLDIKNLQIYTFQLNAEWLEYIRVCRGYGENREEIKAVYEKYDVLIGPTADDKLFDTVQQYLDGELDTSTTVRYLNVAGLRKPDSIKNAKCGRCTTFYNIKRNIWTREAASEKNGKRRSCTGNE